MSSALKSATPSNKSAKAKKKREEEERKKKEEEEAQQRAEIAEKERLENEKRLAQEKSNIAKEITELRRRELTEFYDFIKPRQQEAIDIREKQREEYKWKRIMQCDGTPDPTILPEINTFISLWHDEARQLDIKYTMKQTNLVLSLIRELTYVTNSIPNGSPELERVSIYKNTIRELEDTLRLKWLHTAHFMMLKASDLQDLETNNFEYTAENENATMCIWGNLSHNPRIKGYQFDKYGFGFDLPKPLSLANIAIIGFFLKYDYYSERSLLSKCRVQANEYSYDPIPEPYVDESEKQPAEDGNSAEDQFDASLPPELRKLMEETRQREEAAAAEAQANRENTMTDQSGTQIAPDATSEGKSLTQLSLDKKKSNEDKSFSATADQILEELADESVVDLRSHWPVLPLLEINLYNIPPQPKKVQEWIIVEVDDQKVLVPYQYPSDPMIAERFYEEYSSNKSKTDLEAGKGKADEKPEEPLDPSMTLDATILENNPEIRKMVLDAAIKQESALVLKYKIPNDVFVSEKPLLARWIKDRNHWRQEGYVEYQYTPETRMISFKTYDFGTYALLNDRHAHMPFQSWRMRPKSVNHLLFTLTTQSFEITFEVRYDKVAVFLPPRKSEVPIEDKSTSLFGAKGAKPGVVPPASTSSLSTSRPGVDDGDDIYKTHPAFANVVEPIANKFMPLKELIEKLRLLGLNVFPEPDSDSYVSVINKNHKLEWWAYNQMAIVSSCTAFSYSHWNAFVNDEMKVVVGCKEHLVDQSTADDDPQCIIFTSELVGFTDICESSQEFVEASTFSDYHSELFHLVREKFSAEASARVMDSNPLFMETVNQLLSSIKPLTYA